ncbi:MAG: copper-binding protein [Deltaproteobacteria bacterium]|jgi:Cu/Ag efflux protein CusF|nr:copper-binding protein [Deltaproteobacteria bacterium]
MKYFWLFLMTLAASSLMGAPLLLAQHGFHSMGHDHSQNEKLTAPPAAPPKAAPAAVPGGIADGIYSGRGLVQSLDPAKLTIVLDHEAIPAVNWPGMVMAFQAESADLLAELAPGDQVRFDLKFQNGKYLIVDLEKQPAAGR